MRILFVHPAAAMSIADVARGYRSALERQGHDIRDYSLRSRFEYHTRALPEAAANDMATLSRQASENVLNEAMYHESELVLIMSGLNLHPIALWLLGKAGIKAAVVLTESPYDDDSQKQWADLNHVGSSVDLTIFTNDRYSALKYGWHFLAPAFDPSIHRPVEPKVEEMCDVLMVGTGWRERQVFLEAVDWSGIDLRLFGLWPEITADSPLHRYLNPLVVDNFHIAGMYCSAKVCINFHRRSTTALTPGPRLFEVAACGAFQVSDPRPDLEPLFGHTVPTFNSPEELGQLIRRYMVNVRERKMLAELSRELVQSHTFDNRAAELIDVLTRPHPQSQSQPQHQPVSVQGA